MAKFSTEQLRIKAGQTVDLAALASDETFGLDKDTARDLTRELDDPILELQQRLYAEKNQSLLIVLQAMDAAGKDSTIRKLTTDMNAQGCHVSSFGKPSKRELAHDFLWRVHSQVPQKGHVAIFNRSHYEDVLIVKVHGWCKPEHLERRYDHINNFEALLADNGTKVVKIMLHISPEYQLSRFKSRLENPGKNWKFNPGDLVERGHWEDYMRAFETALSRCSTDQAPWYVIPAENRWFRDYAINSIVYDTLLAMNPRYPEPDYDANKYSPDTIR